jgi:Holliday junction resolvase RusA-like endonuclease
MKLTILGEPKPKQSARFYKAGRFVKSYQTKDVKQNESNIRAQIIEQLPKGFIPFDKPIRVTKLHYVFPIPKSFTKTKLRKIQMGGIIYKHTRPDLTDNLAKGLFDAMESVVFINDSLIVSLDDVKKYYGIQPRIEIELEEIL